MIANYCLIKQNLASLVADSSDDSDRYPDVAQISGQVTFTPTTPQGQTYKIQGEDGELYTVPVTAITAAIEDGKIMHEGNEGVYLFAAGSLSNPERIVYRASYSGLRAGGSGGVISLNTVTFEAIPGGEIDLTTVTPVSGTPAPGIVKGDKGDVGPAATIVSHEALPSGDVQVEFSDGTVITVPSGETPYVKNGNWWIGEQDTGVVADGVDQVRDALTAQISTIESNAERAEVAAAGTESAITRNASKGQQMIVNGNGQLGADYWPSYVRAVGEDVPLGAYCSWEYPNTQAVVWHDLSVVIDPSHPTYMSGFFRQVEDTTANCYLALGPMDQDGQVVTALNVMYVSGTLTKLAQDLKPGDTKVYLESAENWVNTGSGNSNKRMIFWNHVSKDGKVWEPETYSRNVSLSAWEAGGINYDENTITLLKPWSSETIPAGTPLSNGNNGANYMYAYMSSSVGSSWKKLEGTVQGGIDLSGNGFSPGRGWPPGVAAVRPGVLLNYGSNQSISNNRFANIYLSQLAPLGHTHTVSDISDIKVDKDTGGVTIAGIPVDGRGPEGPQGEPGPLTFEDFTPEQLETLKGEPGEVTLEQLNQAIRVDTSVGTRVLSGDVMIYGDTGARRIENLATGVDTEGASHYRVVLRRIGDTVTLYGTGISTGARELVEGIPRGFLPMTGEFRGSLGVIRSGSTVHTVGNNSRSSEIRAVSGQFDAGDLIDFTATWQTDDPWPSSLLGTPA